MKNKVEALIYQLETLQSEIYNLESLLQDKCNSTENGEKASEYLKLADLASESGSNLDSAKNKMRLLRNNLP